MFYKSVTFTFILMTKNETSQHVLVEREGGEAEREEDKDRTNGIITIRRSKWMSEGVGKVLPRNVLVNYEISRRLVYLRACIVDASRLKLILC